MNENDEFSVAINYFLLLLLLANIFILSFFKECMCEIFLIKLKVAAVPKLKAQDKFLHFDWIKLFP